MCRNICFKVVRNALHLALLRIIAAIHSSSLHFRMPFALCRATFMPFVLVAFAVAAQDPLHRRITMQDGLPSNTVYRCMEDREGFLWISSDAGVVRFDGTHLDVFGLEQGLSDEDVFNTSCDPKGRIWFYTANGRPSYIEKGVVHSWRTDPLLAKVQLRSGISALREDANGALWFGGLRGELAVIHPDGRVTDHDIRDPHDGKNRSQINLYPREDGSVQVFSDRWPVDLDGRAMAMDPLGPSPASTMAPPGKEPFLIVGFDSVIAWHSDHWAVLITREELPGAPSMSTVTPVGDDELWISLRNGGVLWMRRIAGKWVPVRDIMFQDDLVTHIMRDKIGNLWMCTSYGGLIAISPRGIGTTFHAGSRGGHEEFLRLHASDGAGVWAGTNQGDVYRLDHRLELVDLPPYGPVFSRVNSIRSQGDMVWVATDRKIFRLDVSREPVDVKHIPAYTTPPEREAVDLGIKALAMANNGRVVGSTYGLLEYDPSRQAFRSIVDTIIPTVRIYAPHFDASGTLWFEENGSLNSISGSGGRSHPQVDLEQGFRITDIVSIADTLILATNGKGLLVVVDGHLIRRITRADGLSSDRVNHVFVHNGVVFVASDRGADQVCGPWAKPVVYRYMTGLFGAYLHVRDVVADTNWVYVLHADGSVRLPRSAGPITLAQAKPYIRSVRVNDSLLTDHSVVGIRGARDRLVVELGAIQFAGQERVHLQFRLLPDGTWQQAFGGLVDLSSTPPGNHVLQVRAGIAQDAWSAPIELPVFVVPPILDRWWAKALLVLFAAVLVFVVLRSLAYRRYRHRVAQLREREALAAARQRMAMDLHDDLGAEISSILLLTRMEREQPAPTSLDRVEQLIGTLAEKVKEVIWSTDPGSDTLEATLAFIQRHTIKIGERHGLRVRTTIPTLLPHVELDAGRRQELYLIAKEAVNNTVKHAGATALTLIVTVDQGTLELDLADDGSGGAASQQDNVGSGLRNMRKRAGVIGASLAISDVEPHGTRITLRLPMDPDNPNG